MLSTCNKTQEDTNQKLIVLIQNYNPDNNTLQDIVTKSWSMVTKNPHLKQFSTHELIIANGRPKNLRDLLTSSSFKEGKKRKGKSKKCWNTKNCRYCPFLNTEGTITSKVTGRKYVFKNKHLL